MLILSDSNSKGDTRSRFGRRDRRIEYTRTVTDDTLDDSTHRLDTETQLSATTESTVAPRLDVPALTIVAHPDSRRVGERVLLPGLVSDKEQALSRREPLFAAPGSERALPLGDVHISRRPLLLSKRGSSDAWAVERSECRAPVRIDGETLGERHDVTAAELVRGVLFELGRRVALLFHLHPMVEPELPDYGLIGASAPMLDLRRQIRLASGLDGAVLLRGATGTGKELVARALHQASARRHQPFVAVNMAAIPASLAASELFGATKGAYTGAGRARQGFFQRAHGGTLFLDEIGETPSEIQPLLLRVLEGGEIQPVGGAATHSVDVRVVAATDADLDALVAAGRFRAPLLHRLATFEIHLPPLDQRRDDIARLLQHFLTLELETFDRDPNDRVDGKPWPPAELVTRLVARDWPGNVRQLRSVARRLAAARKTGEASQAEQLVAPLLSPSGGAPSRATPSTTHRSGDPTVVAESGVVVEALERAIRKAIENIATGGSAPVPVGRWLTDDLVLEAHAVAGGEVRRAAELLSLPETSFRRWLRRSQIDTETVDPAIRSELRRAIAEVIRHAARSIPDLHERLQRFLLREATACLPEPIAARTIGITVRTLRKRRRALGA